MKKIKDTACLLSANQDLIASFKTMVFCNFVMKKSAKAPKCTQNETAMQCLGSLISREE